MPVIKDVLRSAKHALRCAGIVSFTLDAEVLLAFVLKCERGKLLALPSDYCLTKEQYKLFNSILKRRIKGECCAYITGKKFFRDIELNVNKSVLVPRPETESLVEAALEFLNAFLGGVKVLDLCTGSGAAALAIAYEYKGGIQIYASDISAAALKVAQSNAALLPPEKREDVIFLKSNLFNKIKGRFNLIISNPPYVPDSMIKTLSKEVKREPRIALAGGGDGLSLIKKIIAGAPRRLEAGGALMLEGAPFQMEQIRGYLARANFTNIFTKKDLSGAPRIAGGIRP